MPVIVGDLRADAGDRNAESGGYKGLGKFGGFQVFILHWQESLFWFSGRDTDAAGPDFRPVDLSTKTKDLQLVVETTIASCAARSNAPDAVCPAPWWHVKIIAFSAGSSRFRFSNP
jgi:hypothetical protein